MSYEDELAVVARAFAEDVFRPDEVRRWVDATIGALEEIPHWLLDAAIVRSDKDLAALLRKNGGTLRPELEVVLASSAFLVERMSAFCALGWLSELVFSRWSPSPVDMDSDTRKLRLLLVRWECREGEDEVGDAIEAELRELCSSFSSREPWVERLFGQR